MTPQSHLARPGMRTTVTRPPRRKLRPFHKNTQVANRLLVSSRIAKTPSLTGSSKTLPYPPSSPLAPALCLSAAVLVLVAIKPARVLIFLVKTKPWIASPVSGSQLLSIKAASMMTTTRRKKRKKPRRQPMARREVVRRSVLPRHRLLPSL